MVAAARRIGRRAARACSVRRRSQPQDGRASAARPRIYDSYGAGGACPGASEVMAVRARRIVVLGMMTKVPVPGVIWQTVHYLLGFQRLGFDVYYVEAHACTPSMLMRSAEDDGRCHGMSERALRRLLRDA